MTARMLSSTGTDPEADHALLRDVFKLPHVNDGGYIIFGLPLAEMSVHQGESNNAPALPHVRGHQGISRGDGEAQIACTAVQDQGWGLVTEMTLPGGGKLNVYQPRRPASISPVATFVCAHGAGGHIADRSMTAVAKALEAVGLDVVRFNFPVPGEGLEAARSHAVLKESIAAVAAKVRGGKLVIGGRSMGGRAASMLAADGFECDGVLLLAYPLHPAGQPEKLRVAHLASIGVPVLCFNGTRDSFAGASSWRAP